MNDDIYRVKIGGVIADPYRIAIAYELDPVIAQAVKKLLRCGQKHKSQAVDVQEAITTLLRWEEIQQENAAALSKGSSDGGVAGTKPPTGGNVA